MKRFTLPTVFAVVFAIGLAAFHEFTDPYPVKEIAEYWVLFGFMWFCGIVVALLCVYTILRILKSSPSSWSAQSIRAAVLLILFCSVLFGWVAQGLFSRAFTIFVFGNPLTVLRIHVSDTFGGLSSILFVTSLAYGLYRIAERNRRRHGRTPTETRNAKDRVALLSKLSIAGIIVLAISIWFGNIETNRRMQLGVLDRKWNTESDSLIRCLVFENRGVSYQRYLETMVQACVHLQKARARLVIVPLPTDLEPSEVNKTLVRTMADLGMVVFAVSADEKSEEPMFSVDPPLENAIPIKWGVISAQSLPSRWWWPYKYFPLSYHEAITGPLVPDVALVAVAEYLGYEKGMAPKIEDSKLSMGGYVASVSGDNSLQILHRIYPMLPYQFYVKASDTSDSVEFAVGGTDVPIRSGLTDREWQLMEGKIVLVEAGNPITKTWNFAWTYANIIHNILNHQSVLPLASWTPFIVVLTLLIVGGLVVLLRTWLALLSCAILAIIQGNLFGWLALNYGVGIEFVAPITAVVLGLFAFSFVLIADERKQMDKLEKKRIVEELKAAHDMQMGLMPTEDPKITGFDISGLCNPADEVGGDFFDYVWLDEKRTRLGIAIGDVSGKAMKAAITAVLTSGMVYREASMSETPKSILRKINKPIYLKTDRRMFTAMTFAIIDIRRKMLTFSNAGQMQPLLRRNGTIQPLKVRGVRVPLGMMEEADYQEVSLKLRSNDLLLFYTDGVVEAMNEKKEMFGFERLESIVKDTSNNQSAKGIVQDVVGQVQQFTAGVAQHDDMTLVVVKVGGTS